jgi:hypothetical protein
MKNAIIHCLIVVFCFVSCSKDITAPLQEMSPIDVFEEFWQYVDQQYIYFEEKNVDWNEIYTTYRNQLTESTTEQELLSICESALKELKDSHNQIKAPFSQINKFDYREGYDIQFDLDVIKNNYLTDKLEIDGNLQFTIMESDIGYIYLPSMGRYRAFPQIVKEMKDQGVNGLIIDIRNNGGGDSDPLIDMMNIFVQETTTLGYYVEKSGPNHDEKTNPIGVTIEPSDFYFGLPTVILTNRTCYSAASYMAAFFKNIPNVTIVGQLTGGGGGGNLSIELSNGWIVAVSTSDFLDKEFITIENGVKPDIDINNKSENLVRGIDDMLDTAIEIILN